MYRLFGFEDRGRGYGLGTRKMVGSSARSQGPAYKDKAEEDVTSIRVRHSFPQRKELFNHGNSLGRRKGDGGCGTVFHGLYL